MNLLRRRTGKAGDRGSMRGFRRKCYLGLEIPRSVMCFVGVSWQWMILLYFAELHSFCGDAT